jgi:thiol-disulfide isomerase/thioredoxin
MLKYFILIGILGFTIFLFSFQSKADKVIPSVTLKDMMGKQVNSSELTNGDRPFIIAFWGSYCPHCHEELENISEVYEDWQDELGVKLIAIAIDDARTSKKVKPYVNGRGWEFEVYLDENNGMMKALSVTNLPYIVVVDTTGKIVFERFQYYDRAEDDLYDFISKL